MQKSVLRTLCFGAVATVILLSGCGDNWIKGGDSAGVNEFLGYFSEGAGNGDIDLCEGRLTLTVRTEPANGGTVSVPARCYDALATVNITATPNTGYWFRGWSGAATSFDTTITVTMNSNLTLTANFSLYGTVTDPRDNQSYPTVRIGNQTWMAKNLNFNASGSVCYDNQQSNCDIYGRLYDWATAMGFESDCNVNSCASQIQTPHHRGICPVGWHIPSDDEWEALTDFVGANAGTKLKSNSRWDGTNEYGFSALPGGYGNGGSFSYVGSYGFWWSATENDAGYAWIRSMNSGHENVFRGWDIKSFQFSVACLQG